MTLRTAAPFLLVVFGLVIGYPRASAEVAEDPAIRETALDYIEGWYQGDAARMERALHPELAKRMVATDPRTHKSVLSQMGAMTLVQKTRAGIGTSVPVAKRRAEVTVLDRYNHAAVVKVVAVEWVDYLEMAKVDGQWKIINVLWELMPPTLPASTPPPAPAPPRP